jgi:hypothetical protein
VFSPAAFSIGNVAYVGTGRDSSQQFRKDFFQYSPLTGIQVQEEPDLYHISPNPTSGWFTIEFQLPLSSYEIYDMHGKELIHKLIDANTSSLMVTHELPSGIYFVKVNANSIVTLKKLLVAL